VLTYQFQWELVGKAFWAIVSLEISDREMVQVERAEEGTFDTRRINSSSCSTHSKQPNRHRQPANFDISEP